METEFIATVVLEAEVGEALYARLTAEMESYGVVMSRCAGGQGVAFMSVVEGFSEAFGVVDGVIRRAGELGLGEAWVVEAAVYSGSEFDKRFVKGEVK